MSVESGVATAGPVPAAESRPLAARLPLVALLVVVFHLEVILNRVGARLLHRDLLAPPGWLRNSVDVVGLFWFYFAGALAVLVVTIGLLRVLIFSSTIPRGARGAMSALGVAFVPLLVLGLWLRLPGPLQLYLQASFTGLALMLMVSGAVGRGAARGKAGMALLTAPLLLHLAAAIVLARDPTARELSHALLIAGEITMLLAALVSPLLLSPSSSELSSAGRRGVRGWLVPGVVGLLVGGAVAAGVSASSSMAARVAAYALGVDLPPGLAGTLLLAVALAAWATVVARLLGVPGRTRMRGYGLLLIGLAGFQLDQPGQLAGALIGLMSIVVSYEPEPTADPDEWRSVIEQVAVIVGAAQVHVGGGGGEEEARMRFLRGDESVELMLARRRGDLYLVELVCGVAPAGAAPPLSLTRRGTERLGKSDGEIVATGDVAFDELFRVADARHLEGPDPLLDDETRAALCEHLEGWVGVWPGQGARYRSRHARFVDQLLAAGPDARTSLLSLVDLVLRLRGR